MQYCNNLFNHSSIVIFFYMTNKFVFEHSSDFFFFSFIVPAYSGVCFPASLSKIGIFFIFAKFTHAKKGD